MQGLGLLDATRFHNPKNLGRTRTVASVSDDEIREVLDRDDIRQLMYKYAHCWDNLDFRGWATCFTPDGVYYDGGGPVLTGYDELLSYCEETSPRVQGRYHLQMNQYVQV